MTVAELFLALIAAIKSALAGLMAFLVAVAVPASWPLVAVLFIWMFRKEIAEFIGRILEVGLKGVKAAPPSQEPPPPSSTTAVANLPPEPSLAHWERRIEQDAADVEVRIGSARPILIRALAFNLRLALFEQSARMIFGSQIAALRLLNMPRSRTDLQPTYQTHTERAASARNPPLDFMAWLAFLTSREFVTHAEGDNYQRTEIGLQFLQFLDNLGINEQNRAF